jgi:hypothetical protein
VLRELQATVKTFIRETSLTVMNLFQVPGWSVPAVASNPSMPTGKRKRPRNSQQPVERSETAGNNRDRKKRKRTSNEDDAVKAKQIVPMSDPKASMPLPILC